MNNIFRSRPRLWISCIAGTGLFFFLPPHWTVISRILVCWDCGVGLFLGLIYYWMTGLSAERIRSRYVEEDPRRISSSSSSCAPRCSAWLRLWSRWPP